MQLVEPRGFEPLVVGSIPTAPAKVLIRLMKKESKKVLCTRYKEI